MWGIVFPFTITCFGIIGDGPEKYNDLREERVYELALKANKQMFLSINRRAAWFKNLIKKFY